MTSHWTRGRDLVVAIVALALTVGTLSCRETTYPFPANAMQMPAREQYAMWWNVTQACSKVSGPFSAVTWYVVPGPSTFLANGVASYGAYYPDSHSIFIAESSLDDGWVVRHEMLHALTGQQGHPSEYFQTRCGGIVECGPSDCAPLPPVPSDAPIVAPANLAVSIAVTPEVFSDGATGGWFAIVVSATNTAAIPVWAKLNHSPVPHDPNPADSVVFSWGYTTTATPFFGQQIDAERVAFAAGETKRYTFDLDMQLNGGHIAPGTYRFLGTYNSATAPPATIVVSKP